MSGRAARWLAGGIVVLLVLLAVADRVGVAIAERVAGDNLESSEHLRSRPDVDISGFPFLTQLASGDYDKVTVTARDVPVGRQVHLLVLSRLKVVLHGLSVGRNFDRFHAQTAEATASIGFNDLSETLGVDISYAGGGRIRASKTVTAAGVSVDATVTTRPELAGDTLRFVNTSVDNVGAVGGAAAAGLQQAVGLTIPMRNVPFGVRVRGLDVDEGGITIALAGRDVEYAR